MKVISKNTINQTNNLAREVLSQSDDIYNLDAFIAKCPSVSNKAALLKCLFEIVPTRQSTELYREYASIIDDVNKLNEHDLAMYEKRERSLSDFVEYKLELMPALFFKGLWKERDMRLAEIQQLKTKRPEIAKLPEALSRLYEEYVSHEDALNAFGEDSTSLTSENALSFAHQLNRSTQLRKKIQALIGAVEERTFDELSNQLFERSEKNFPKGEAFIESLLRPEHNSTKNMFRFLLKRHRGIMHIGSKIKNVDNILKMTMLAKDIEFLDVAADFVKEKIILPDVASWSKQDQKLLGVVLSGHLDGVDGQDFELFDDEIKDGLKILSEMQKNWASLRDKLHIICSVLMSHYNGSQPIHDFKKTLTDSMSSRGWSEDGLSKFVALVASLRNLAQHTRELPKYVYELVNDIVSQTSSDVVDCFGEYFRILEMNNPYHKMHQSGDIQRFGNIDGRQTRLLEVSENMSGQIAIFPDKENRKWTLATVNTGQVPYSFTQNYFPSRKLAQESEEGDDYEYGHGVLVSDEANTGWVDFEVGGDFNLYQIEEQGFVRLGVRGHAACVVQLPKLDGEPTYISLEQMDWYSDDEKRGETADSIHRQGLEKLDALFGSQKKTVKDLDIAGAVNIEAIEQNGELIGWDVEFKNYAHQGYTGTIAFEGTSGKNAGYGLESMPVPKRSSRAKQRIWASQNYGVEPKANRELRVGIRGLGSGGVMLPAKGEVSLLLPYEVLIQDSVPNMNYFDTEILSSKRNEKIGRVEFYEGKENITSQLKPEIFDGPTALARSTFNPPEMNLSVDAVDEEYVFKIDVSSMLPEKDEHGRMTLKLNALAGGSSLEKGRELIEILDKETFEFRVKKERFNEHASLVLAFPGTGWFFEVEPSGIEGSVSLTDKLFFREDLAFRGDLRPINTEVNK